MQEGEGSGILRRREKDTGEGGGVRNRVGSRRETGQAGVRDGLGIDNRGWGGRGGRGGRPSLRQDDRRVRTYLSAFGYWFRNNG